MPRFYFHIVDGRGLVPDEEGSELANLDAARAEAKQSALELVFKAMRSGIIEHRSLEIADEEGRILETKILAGIHRNDGPEVIANEHTADMRANGCIGLEKDTPNRRPI